MDNKVKLSLKTETGDLNRRLDALEALLSELLSEYNKGKLLWLKTGTGDLDRRLDALEALLSEYDKVKL